MIPLALFANPTFSAAVATTFLLCAAIYSAAFLTSQFFQFSLGDSPLGTGLRFLPWTATPLVVVPIAGVLFDRIGARPLAVPGLSMQAGGFASIVALVRDHAGYGSYVVPFVIAGIGISMSIPAASAAALSAAPRESLGKAAGISNTLQQFGAVFGIAIVTAVFNAKGSLVSRAAVEHGYRPALVVAAGFSVLERAVVAINIRRMRHQVAPATELATELGELTSVAAAAD